MSALKGRALEDYVVNNISKLLPNADIVSRQHEQGADQGFDIHAKDSRGIDYFFEVKSSECNRLNIGQIVEYKARLASTFPKAKIILVCRSVDESVKDLVRKIGVDIWTFSDLGITENLGETKKEEKEKAELSPVEQKAYFALLKHGSTLVKTEDLASVLSISASYAKNVLSKLAKKGVAQRVGRGKYVIIPADVVYGRKSYVGDPLVLISEMLIDRDYYVAYYSAAQFHGLTEQLSFKNTVAVLKQIRPVQTGNIFVDFVKLKKSRFFGFAEEKYSGTVIKVSDIEKTLVDCVARPDLCGGIPEVARIILNTLEHKQIDYQKFVSYLKRFESYAAAQRTGFLIEYIAEKHSIKISSQILNQIYELIGPKIYSLDAKNSKGGEISKKWKINNNTGYLEV